MHPVPYTYVSVYCFLYSIC